MTRVFSVSFPILPFSFSSVLTLLIHQRVVDSNLANSSSLLLSKNGISSINNAFFVQFRLYSSFIAYFKLFILILFRFPSFGTTIYVLFLWSFVSEYHSIYGQKCCSIRLSILSSLTLETTSQLLSFLLNVSMTKGDLFHFLKIGLSGTLFCPITCPCVLILYPFPIDIIVPSFIFPSNSHAFIPLMVLSVNLSVISGNPFIPIVLALSILKEYVVYCVIYDISKYMQNCPKSQKKRRKCSSVFGYLFIYDTFIPTVFSNSSIMMLAYDHPGKVKLSRISSPWKWTFTF